MSSMSFQFFILRIELRDTYIWRERERERENRCKKSYKNNCCEFHIVHRFTMRGIHSSSSQKLLLWIPVDTRTLSVETSGQVNFAMTIGTADFKNLLYSVNHLQSVHIHTNTQTHQKHQIRVLLCLNSFYDIFQHGIKQFFALIKAYFNDIWLSNNLN